MKDNKDMKNTKDIKDIKDNDAEKNKKVKIIKKKKKKKVRKKSSVKKSAAEKLPADNKKPVAEKLLADNKKLADCEDKKSVAEKLPADDKKSKSSKTDVGKILRCVKKKPQKKKINKVVKLREKIKASKSEKWVETMSNIMKLQNTRREEMKEAQNRRESEEEKTEEIPEDKTSNVKSEVLLREISKMSRRKPYIKNTANTANTTIVIQNTPQPIQNTMAVVFYPYSKNRMEIDVTDVKQFLNKYLPKIGSSQEVKNIVKEHKKLTTAIKSCQSNTAGFITYKTRRYYTGRKVVEIEIKRGRKKN